MAISNLDMTNVNLDLKGKLLNNRYYLYELIANNNHRQVFCARDIVKRRQCVIKRLYLNFCPEKVKRTIESMFRQEAKILKTLTGKHSQISQFYNYFSDDSSLYLVQEWIAGVTLEQKLHRQKKLPESETREIILNLLPVLEYIHSLGIIHSDIKPHNIMLRDQDNLPVLIDFGIAQQISAQHQPRVIVGTPGYMSLEQARGQTLYSNDLYSLGLTAIHLLTGQLPQTVDLKHQEILISHHLMKVINQAIAPEPNRRFNSAREMRLALLSTSTSTIVLPTKNRDKSQLKLWVLFLILGIQISGVWIGWRYLAAELNGKPSVNLFPEESLIATEDEPIAINNTNIFENIIFAVGTSNQKIIQALGEPVWRKPGFWANSIAWSYEDIISQGIDLGYIFDVQTNKLRQVEIAVPPSTNFSTLQAALTSLLSTKTSPNLEQGLAAVYHRRQLVYNFTKGDLEGIIQRNDQDRIYMAVWSADFH